MKNGELVLKLANESLEALNYNKMSSSSCQSNIFFLPLLKMALHITIVKT